MWVFNTKGASGFSSSSTAEEVTQGIDGSGLTAIVTGASSGVGSETARVLALRGVHVIMGVRNMEAGTKVKEAIIKGNPSAKIHSMQLDLSSLASVRKFADDNNAGIMATPFMLSEDNIELQFATNHIGHFLLTNLLMNTIKKTASESKKEGRIVNVSSRRHKFSYPEGIHFTKINDPSGYNSLSAYGQSKLANVLHSNELSRRLQDDGAQVTANSVHPGLVDTNLFRHQNIIISGFMGILGKLLVKNVQQGAATTCYIALHPQVEGVSGQYFADSNIVETSSQAADRNLAKKLWDFSLDLVNNGPRPVAL